MKQLYKLKKMNKKLDIDVDGDAFSALESNW